MDDLKIIEHSTLKVPYEHLNKLYRNVHKSIDRDCSSINQSMSQIDKLAKSAELGQKSDMVASLGTLVEKLHQVKKRSIEMRNQEKDLLEILKKRIQSLKEHSCHDLVSRKNFFKKRLDRVLIDYFLRNSYYQSAEALAAKADLKDMTNIDVFMVEKEICESLMNKETQRCLSWCSDNKSKLKKINSNLEFALRQQEFIELVRQQKCLEAVHHARKHFVSLNPAQLVDVQKSMVLLAYAKCSESLYNQELLSDSRWTHLIGLFKQENYKINQIPEQSALETILQSGLSALKTPTCYKKVTAVINHNCPVCNANFNQIARPLPFAYCSNSKLIDSYTGEAINEHNQPMMLPNGYVYGYNSLVKLMSENDGKIRCPRSQEEFEFGEVQKVFIL
ncbi:Macrophage erythroblast attacher [Brachionus plicatilis]|uniref:E3 ubiquitin-protein transferase MAEA n=1 Tax=Brachionus plicatilis TaxID=10195 RepID=A0A3M7R880_BRAPC|nr:Macrophage erythroblast attacher [Brachionus plicatilis]